MTKKNFTIQKMAAVGLLSALVFIFSGVRIQFGEVAAVHLGNGFCALAGLLFGCGLSEGAALLMFRQTGIMLSPQLTLAEGSFAAASFALGSLCALFPAYMVYRKTGAVALGDSE